MNIHSGNYLLNKSKKQSSFIIVIETFSGVSDLIIEDIKTMGLIYHRMILHALLL